MIPWLFRGLVMYLCVATVGATLSIEHTHSLRPSSALGRRPLAAPAWHPSSFKNKKPAGEPAPERQESTDEESTDEADGQESSEASSSVSSPARTAPYGHGITDAEVMADPCPVIFAAFFVSKPGGFERPAGVRCNGCHESPMHITFDSAKILHPTACVAVLTDLETDFTKIEGMESVQFHRFADVVNRSHIGTPNLMYERMKIYRAFVDRASKANYNKHLILLDTDIVIVGDLLHIFAKHTTFDYALSVRANDNLPVQGGLQLVHKDKLTEASDWLTLVLDEWLERTKKAKRYEFGFTGDQYAYAITIGEVKSVFKRAQAGEIDSLNVKRGDKVYNILMVPADKYNRTPSGPGSSIKKQGIAVLHYKGGRKAKMYVTYNALKKGGLKALYALKGMT